MTTKFKMLNFMLFLVFYSERNANTNINNDQ